MPTALEAAPAPASAMNGIFRLRKYEMDVSVTASLFPLDPQYLPLIPPWELNIEMLPPGAMSSPYAIARLRQDATGLHRQLDDAYRQWFRLSRRYPLRMILTQVPRQQLYYDMQMIERMQKYFVQLAKLLLGEASYRV